MGALAGREITDDHTGVAGSCCRVSRIRHKIKPAAPFHPETLDWSKLIADVSGTKSTTGADKVTKASSPNKGRTLGYRDEAFREDMNASPGWTDLELLLRTLAKVHARPLLLSMPFAGDFYNEKGVSRSAREHYYAKLRALVQRYHFPLLEIEATMRVPLFSTFKKVILMRKVDRLRPRAGRFLSWARAAKLIKVGLRRIMSYIMLIH